ncbi:MAG: helix-turn-helix domain-containing protein, partial [Chloroflexi bacterium]|nr:helix-turn-helix domain-containing protein [Chloroflexota bacterium]
MAGADARRGRHPRSLQRDPPDLRQRREALKLTQAELAAALGVTPNTVARWERGEQRQGQPERIERVLAELETQGRRPVSRAAPLNFPAARRPPDSGVSSGEVSPAGQRGVPVLEVNTFVGRETAIEEVQFHLRRSRLVTLSGPGGIGKTRLALHACQSLPRDIFVDGVYVVELAELTDSRLLAQTVAASLGMRLPPRRTPLEGLVAAIGSREMLVLLDNCESLATGCAELCNAVGLGCPATTILATSRMPLGASGEMVWSVPPLELPAPDAVLVEHVQHSPAAQLLVERIRAHHVQFR